MIPGFVTHQVEIGNAVHKFQRVIAIKGVVGYFIFAVIIEHPEFRHWQCIRLFRIGSSNIKQYFFLQIQLHIINAHHQMIIGIHFKRIIVHEDFFVMRQDQRRLSLNREEIQHIARHIIY